ncbi:TPA: hypothetical protein ACGUTZ_003929 [Vibrio vulnificus]|nr:hypothetical protein [Vibrio vulnificus]
MHKILTLSLLLISSNVAANWKSFDNPNQFYSPLVTTGEQLSHVSLSLRPNGDLSLSISHSNYLLCSAPKDQFRSAMSVDGQAISTIQGCPKAGNSLKVVASSAGVEFIVNRLLQNDYVNIDGVDVPSEGFAEALKNIQNNRPL